MHPRVPYARRRRYMRPQIPGELAIGKFRPANNLQHLCNELRTPLHYASSSISTPTMRAQDDIEDEDVAVLVSGRYGIRVGRLWLCWGERSTVRGRAQAEATAMRDLALYG